MGGILRLGAGGFISHIHWSFCPRILPHDLALCCLCARYPARTPHHRNHRHFASLTLILHISPLQELLDNFRNAHNKHRVRKTPGAGRPAGYVDVMWLKKKVDTWETINEQELNQALMDGGLGSLEDIYSKAEEAYWSKFPLSRKLLWDVRERLAEEPRRQTLEEEYLRHRDISCELFE